jgi:tetratricopeptide (TPR) repeat protein
MGQYPNGDQPVVVRAGSDNKVCGATISGTIVQAGTVDGGVHIHAASPVPPPVPRQLPRMRVHLEGRSDELATLDEFLKADAGWRTPVLPLVTGPGGVGKTALALSWCHSVAHRFADGQLSAALGGGSGLPADPADVLGGFLVALGESPEDIPPRLTDRAALFRTRTAHLRVLVLLDDIHSAAQVRSLLPGSASCLVVLTSRRRLTGLLAEGARLVELAPLAEDSSVALLTRSVGRRRTELEPAEIRELARRCGGLPLALCVAGAKLAARPHWRIDKLLVELRDEQNRLRALAVDGEPAVHATFDASYRSLSAGAARMYRTMAVHPGPEFGPGVVAAALPGFPIGNATDELVTANLLEEIGDERFRFHDLIRLHARERAEQATGRAEREATLRRMVEWYLDSAVRADLTVMPMRARHGARYVRFGGEPTAFGNPDQAMTWLETERHNLMAAAGAAAGAGFDGLCWQFCEALWGLLLHHKHFPDWLTSHSLGVDDAARCGDGVAEVRTRCQLALGYIDMEQFDTAIEHLVPALELARSLGYEMGEATALEHLGLAHRGRGDLEEALALLRLALEIDERTGRPRAIALRLANIGETLHALGKPGKAAEHLLRARTLFAELPDRYNEAYALTSLAETRRAQGELPQAIGHFREALDIMQDLGSVFQQGQILFLLGDVNERSGDPGEALRCFREATARYERVGSARATEARHRASLLGT